VRREVAKEGERTHREQERLRQREEDKEMAAKKASGE
jgi:hypothetical protein